MSAITTAAEKLNVCANDKQAIPPLIAPALRQSFAAKRLDRFQFEYRLSLQGQQYTSGGYHNLPADDPDQLTLIYLLSNSRYPQASADQLTVIIPYAASLALKDMTWIRVSAVLLTLLLTVILGCTWYWSHRRQQLFNAGRRKAVEQMVAQLKAPLETLNLAAENLQKASEASDIAMLRNHQGIIRQESKRISDLIKKIFSKFE